MVNVSQPSFRLSPPYIHDARADIIPTYTNLSWHSNQRMTKPIHPIASTDDAMTSFSRWREHVLPSSGSFFLLAFTFCRVASRLRSFFENIYSSASGWFFVFFLLRLTLLCSSHLWTVHLHRRDTLADWNRTNMQGPHFFLVYYLSPAALPMTITEQRYSDEMECGSREDRFWQKECSVRFLQYP